MGDNTVIRLDDVRRLKAAGLRLDPPVSAGYNAAWTALTDAQAAFLLAVEAYSERRIGDEMVVGAAPVSRR